VTPEDNKQEPAAVAASETGAGSPEPTPVVSPGDATRAQPAGTAAPTGGDPQPAEGGVKDTVQAKAGDVASTVAQTDQAQQAAAVANERPEVLVGAAFAGGFVAALILKKIAN
jgi:hypothetical protein